MRAALAILLIVLGLTAEAHASALPLCRDTWRGQAHQYDFHEPYAAFDARLRRGECEKEWTVLVYMAADNDLFPFALWDLFEMEAAYQGDNPAGSTLKSDLVVQVDGPAGDDARRLHIYSGPVAYGPRTKEDFEGASLDQVRSPVVEKVPEHDAQTEQQRLESFLFWASERYPSRHTMVIVWGHGQGWKAYPVESPAKSRFLERANLLMFPKAEPDSRFGGIAFRQSAGTWLDIPALSGALRTFRQLLGRPIDVYASDACLMQMLEVSTEISESARFVVGSAQVQSFLGLPYRRLMYELNTGRFNGLRKENRPGVDGTDEAYLLAKMIPQLMKQSLNPRGGGLQSRLNPEAYRFMTSSTLTAGELRTQLLPEIASLSRALKAYVQEDALRVMDLQFVTQSVPSFEGGAQDFGVFLGILDELLRKERAETGGMTRAASTLQESVKRTKEALNRAVLTYAYGPAYGVDEGTQLVSYVPRAISLWLPVSAEEFRKRRGEFEASRFYRETRWQEWLEVVFPR